MPSAKPDGLRKETASAPRFTVIGQVDEIDSGQRVLFLTWDPAKHRQLGQLRRAPAQDRAKWSQAIAQLEAYRREAWQRYSQLVSAPREDRPARLPWTAMPESYPFEPTSVNSGGTGVEEYARAFLWDDDTQNRHDLQSGRHVLLEVAPRQPAANGVYIVSVNATAPADAIQASHAANTFGAPPPSRPAQGAGPVVYGGQVIALDKTSRSFGLQLLPQLHTSMSFGAHASAPGDFPTRDISPFLLDQPTFIVDERTAGADELKDGAIVTVVVAPVRDAADDEQPESQQVLRAVQVKTRQAFVPGGFGAAAGGFGGLGGFGGSGGAGPPAAAPPVSAYDAEQISLLVARNQFRLGFQKAAWEQVDRTADARQAALQDASGWAGLSLSSINIHQIGYANFQHRGNENSLWEVLGDGRIPAARHKCQLALSHSLQLLAESHWFVQDARWSLDAIDRIEAMTAAQRAELHASRVAKQQAAQTALAGHYDRAAAQFQSVLESRARLFGNGHPIVAIAWSDRGFLQYRAGRTTDAAESLERSMEIRATALGDQHPSLLALRLNLAGLREQLGDHAAAQQLAELAAVDAQRLALELGHDRPPRERLQFSPKGAAAAHNAASLPSGLPSSVDLVELVSQTEPVVFAPVVYSDGWDFAMYSGREGRQAAPPTLARLLADESTARVVMAPELATHLAGLFFLPGGTSEALSRWESHLTFKPDPVAKIDRWIPPGAAASAAALAASDGDPAELRELQGRIDRVLHADARYWRSLRRRRNGQARSQRRQAADTVSTGLADFGEIVTQAAAGLATPQQAYDRVVQSKGRDLILESRIRRLEATAPREWLAKARSLSQQYGAVAFNIPPAERQDRWRLLLQQLSQQREPLDARLRISRWLVSQDGVTDPLDIDAGAVQRSLPEGAVLLDYVTYTPDHSIEEMIAAAEQANRRLTARQPVSDRLAALLAPGWTTSANTAKQLGMFVVRKDASIEFVPLGDEQWFVETARRWRAVHGERRATAAADAEPGSQLRRWLLEPAAPYLQDASLLLVSPWGPLASLPFASLPGARPDSYLIEDLAVAYVPAAAALALPKPAVAAGAEGGLLAVGDVDFAAEWIGPQATAPRPAQVEKPFRFTPLPGTASEIKTAEQMYREAFGKAPVVLTRHAATEHSVRRHAPGKQVLVFATHGFYAPELMLRTHFRSEVRSWTGHSLDNFFPVTAPTGQLFERQVELMSIDSDILSGIALAGASRPLLIDPDAIAASGQLPDDGLLTAVEVADLSLRSDSLVVLSACESAIQYRVLQFEENVMGLQRAFHVAGANAVLASVWSVHDQATERLMREFYRQLWQEKRTPVHALREAQLALIRLRGRPEGRLRGAAGLVSDSIPPPPNKPLPNKPLPNQPPPNQPLPNKPLPNQPPVPDPPGAEAGPQPHLADPFCWGAFTLSLQSLSP